MGQERMPQVMGKHRRLKAKPRVIDRSQRRLKARDLIDVADRSKDLEPLWPPGGTSAKASWNQRALPRSTDELARSELFRFGNPRIYPAGVRFINHRPDEHGLIAWIAGPNRRRCCGQLFTTARYSRSPFCATT